MKKTVSLCLFLLLFMASVSAQEQYVEVIAKDTVFVEPQQWTYVINILADYDNSYAIDDTTTNLEKHDNKNNKTSLTISRLKALTAQHHAQILSGLDDINYNIIPKAYDRTGEHLTVRFNNRQSMENFVLSLSEIKDIEGELAECSSPDLSSAYTALDKKLMEQAKQKAAQLAEMSGKRLGNILLVSEATESDNVFHEFLNTVIKYDGISAAKRARLMNSHPDKIKLEKNMKVRFAWK